MALPPGRQAPSMFPSSHPGDKPVRGAPPWAVIGIFLILLFAAITTAAAFLMPVTLAFLLFFVFAPFRRLLGRWGVGAPIAATIVTLGMIVMLGVLGYFVSGPVNDIVEDSPRIAQRLEERFASLRESVKPIEEAARKLDEISGGAAPAAENSEQPATTTTADGATNGTTTVTLDGEAEIVATVSESSVEPPAPGDEIRVSVDTSGQQTTLQTLASAGPAVIGQVIFTTILLFFLLASGDLLYLKIVQSFDTLRDKKAAYIALREIESSLGNYLGAITIINAGLGLAIGLAMWFWGMPQPLLFGLGAFLLNFIPYIGAVAGVGSAALVALIAFDDIYTPIMVGLTYFALTSTEGQLVTPYFVSRRLQLNTVVVFITVALWAWLWSILGMVVAVPMLVVLKVLCDHIPGLQKMGNFLAGEEPPALEDEDEEEARDIVEAGDGADTPAEVEAETARI
ncbi:MAG: AI-2E family transporter [Paracoccus sp. (in: a-proteobacteria)]|nr:AI-2E family transporter [Paracoccus sp. (in: a-proteobacteria)]